MQTKNWFKSSLPTLIAIASFLLLSAIFSAPALKGERLAPHDTVSWIYMSKEAKDYYDANGTASGWANNMFSGMPTSVIYEPVGKNWFGNIMNASLMQPASYLVNPIGFLFACMLGVFILLKAFRVNTLIAAFGGVCYGLTSYIPILIGAGHLTKVMDLAYLPGVIGGLIMVYRGQRIQGLILFTIFLCFFLAAWHLQVIYYSLFIILSIPIYYLVDALKKSTISSYIKSSGLLLLFGLAALITIYSGIKSTDSYAKYSMRGGATELTLNKTDKLKENNGGLTKDYAFSWSNGIGETFCALIPNLYGGASGSNIGENSNYGEALSELGAPSNQIEQMTAQAPTYFGSQPFLSGPIYFGAIVVFLSILGLFVIRSRFKWLLFGAGVFFAMLSWGKNFDVLNYFLFDHFPMFNKFRSPNMALSLTAITTFALAFWGLYEMVKQNAEDKIALFKKFKNAAYVSIGLVIVLIIYSQVLMDYKGGSDEQLTKSFGDHAGKLLSAIKEDRAAMALKDGLRSLAFILIAAGALWAMLKDKITSQVAIIIVGAASIIDLWGVGKRYLNDDMYKDDYTIEQQFFTPTPAVAQIMQDKDPDFKVLDMSIDPFNDAKTSYFVKTIGGYHPAKLQSYQDLIETQISRLNSAVLNMLNTKYIITQDGKVMPNPNALGNAWFVSNIKFTKTADETITSMDAPLLSEPQNDSNKTAAFVPSAEAIVRDQYAAAIGVPNYQKDSSAKIVLTKYDLPYLAYESNNNNEGFAVFSEIYYPEGWTAYIDGKASEIYPVDYVLRGLKVPAGKHKIEFKYKSASLESAAKTETIGSILVTLLLLGAAYFGFQEMKKKEKARA